MGTRAGVFIIIHVKYRNRESTSQNPSEYIFDLASATLHRDNGPPPIWGQILPMPTKLSTWMIDLFFLKKERPIWSKWNGNGIFCGKLGRWKTCLWVGGVRAIPKMDRAEKIHHSPLCIYIRNSCFKSPKIRFETDSIMKSGITSPEPLRLGVRICVVKYIFCNIFWRSVWAKKIPSPLNVYLLVF